MADPAQPGTPDTEPLRPWLGLKSYRTEDRLRFFGRTEEIQELRWRVRGAALTVLYGESGRGKSSLLAAGLLPTLRNDGYSPVIVRLAYDAAAPRLVDQLFAALDSALALERTPAQSDATVAGAASADRASLWEYAHAAGPIAERIGARRPVVIIDQFEEAFTLGRASHNGRPRAGEVAQLFEQLSDLVENRIPTHLRAALVDDPEALSAFDTATLPLSFVLTLREDYLGELEVHSLAMPSLMRNRVRLNELSGQAAMDAVIGPGALHCAGDGDRPLVADAVARRIVCFVAKRADDTPIDAIEAVPPLLSLVCFELNEARIAAQQEEITGELVTRQAKDILHSYYERCFAGTSPAVRLLIEDKLLTQEGGHRATYAREDAVADLRRAGVADPEREIEHLIDGRLLNGEERRGFPQLELTHDVLAPIAMASRAQREMRRRTERLGRTSRNFGIAAAVLLLLSLALGSGVLYTVNLRHSVARTAALQQIESANELFQVPSAQTQAMASLSLAMQSGSIGIGDADGPALRSVLGLAPTFATMADGTARHYVPGSGVLVDVTLPPPARPISVANWSPSGRYYLLADEAGRLGVWATGSDQPVVSTTLTAGCAVQDAAFVDDEQAVIAGTADGKVWRIAIGGAPQEALLLHDFLPDANKPAAHVATEAATLDGEAGAAAETGMSRLAGRDGPPPGGAAQSRPASVAATRGAACPQTDLLLAVSPRDDGFAVGFSSDVKEPAVAGLRVWPKAVPAFDLPLTGSLASLEFDRQDMRLLTATADGTVTAHAWPPHADSPAKPLYRKKDDETISVARLSPDGRWTAIAGGGRIHIRDTRSGRLIATTESSRSDMADLAFDPDGRWLVTNDATRNRITGSSAYSVPLLRKDPSYDEPSGQVRLSPDGLHRLSFAGGTLEIGTLRESNPERSLAHGADVANAAFAPDGRTILTGSADGHGRIWPVAAAAGPEAAYFHDSSVVALDYSRNGARFAAAYDDGSAQVFAASSALPVSPRIWHAHASHLALSSDGEWFATTTDDGTVNVWSSANGSPRFTNVPEAASSAFVESIRFSPDGNHLLLATQEGTALWDLAFNTWKTLMPDAAVHAEFSPDGSLIAVRTLAGTVQLLRGDGTALEKSIGDESEDDSRLEFSQDGSLLLLPGNGRALLYRLPDATLTGSFAGTGTITATAISSDREWIAIADERGVALYRAPFSAGPAQMVKATSVTAIHFLPESDPPAFITVDDTVAQLWNTTAKVPLAELARRDPSSIRQTAWSSDGGQIAIGDSSGRISVLPVDRLRSVDLQPLAAVLTALGKSNPPSSLAAAVASIQTPSLRNSMRYRLDSDLNHHPLLSDVNAPVSIDALYAQLPLQPQPLQHWWQQTRSDLLLARWALASAQRAAADRRLWRRQVRQQLAGSDDPRIRADLALTGVLDEAGGSVLVGGKWQPIDGAIIAELESSLLALPELQFTAAQKPDDRLALPNPPPPVSPLHNGFLPQSTSAAVNEAFDLLSTRQPSDEENARLRKMLDDAQLHDDLLARYLLARLLAMPSRIGTDYRRANRLMTSAADAGVAAAQNSVGWTYLSGLDGQKQDVVLAQRYLRLAAAQGHPYAWNNLGVLEQHSNQDAARAAGRYRRAIELGDASEPHINLATLLEAGDGATRDPRGAIGHYRSAAERGDVQAMFALALRLELGFVEPPDLAEARRWYRRAAAYTTDSKRTDARAAFRLGGLAERAGELAEAATAYHMAARRGHLGAHYALARLLLSNPRLVANHKAVVSPLIRRLLAVSASTDAPHVGLELDWLAGEAYALVNATDVKALPKVSATGKCLFAEDGVCDAPTLCTYESDIIDCEGNASPRACLFENDGQCDVPQICGNGTDVADCAGHRSD